MKKSLRFLQFFALMLFSLHTYGQVSVTVQNLQYTNDGQPIAPPANCGTIALGSSTNTTITLGINLSKPRQQVVGTGNLYVYTQKSSSDFRVQRSWVIVPELSWSQPSSGNSTFFSTASLSINSSDFNVSGGTLFVVFNSNGVEYKTTCSYSITKILLPVFTLSPTTTSVACGSTSPVTFSVTNVHNSPGTLTYSWSTPGWSGTVTPSSSSVILTPSSPTLLPSTVSVTPYLNGVAQPTRSCTVTRPSFTSGATIIGNNSICGASEYSVANLATGLSLTWSSSNTTIATVSNPTGNTITVNKVGAGNFTLTATISNSCGQSVTTTKPITAYTVASLPTPSGYFEADATCREYTNIPIRYMPTPSFGGAITFNPSVVYNGLQAQTINITVRYTNPCTGEYTSRVISYEHPGPTGCTIKTPRKMALNPFYTISPNPSNDIVNINLRDQNSQPAKGVTISGELFDMMGQSKTKVHVSDNKASFSVALLKKGIYVLKIYLVDQVESHQIVVE